MPDHGHFPNAKKYWYEGKLYDWNVTLLHPMTFALHYGGSVFEGIRAYPTPKGAAIFRLPEHVDRLLHSASVAKMKVRYTKNEITEAIKLTLKENGLRSAYLRPLLFYSYGNLGLVPKFCPVELAIGTWEWGAYFGDKIEKGATVCILPWRRIHRSQLDMTAKLGGLYIQSTICAMEARSAAIDEGVFLNLEGRIAEGPGENIFIVRGHAVKTNDGTESVLEGITRTSVLEIAQDLGYKTVIAPITKADFFGAEEAFFSGTAVEITPIVRVIDGSDPQTRQKEYTIGSGQTGPITLRLAKMYKDIVHGKIQKYEKWLTYVVG
jgi:branched-chain amino acid aminotransferase